ncbi:hypothetical protein ONZ45_g14175 [Pleurotus djamor]|nr:hypothetical protein ONZ45_g14175 [Pleurotus djamor]
MPTKNPKRVRFAAKSTVHELPSSNPLPSRPPPPPALSSPQSSATSEESLTVQQRRPPRVLQRPPIHEIVIPIPHTRSHTSFPIPFRDIYTIPLQLHSALLNPSPFKYNCAQHPTTLTITTPDLSPRFPSEPATNLPISSLTIQSPHLPWRITVKASRHGMVTISDVLHAIYKTLRECIHLADFELLSPNDKKRVRKSYEDRYRGLRSSKLGVLSKSGIGGAGGNRKRSEEAAEEKRQGVKKIDFLMGKTRFMGLSATTNPVVWVLITS